MPATPAGAGKSSYDLINPDAFINAIEWKSDMTVLDLACGTGRYTLGMARKLVPPGRVIAVDLWEEGIAQLRRNTESGQPVDVEAHVADIRQMLPIADSAVDLCLMATVLHDLALDGDHEPVLKEVNRVLKPDGVLAVAEFKVQDGPPGPPKEIRIRLEEVSAMLLKIGFMRFSGVLDLGPDIYFAQFRRLSRTG